MLAKVLNSIDHIGYAQASKEARLTLWGVVLVKLGTGVIGVWSVANIYFFSYYKLNTPELKMTNLTLLITIAGLPACILAVLSIRICKRFGFEKIIRGALVLSPISFLIGSQQENFWIFAFSCAFVLSLCLGSTMMPLLYCLWSHFPKKTGNATGIVLTAFGISAFSACLLATFIVNPENIPATIPYTEGAQTFFLFEEEIAKRVPQMSLYLALMQIVACIPGSFLVSLNQEEEEKIQEVEMVLIDEQQQQVDEKKQLTLKEALKTDAFGIIYATSFLISCCWVFVHTNFKTYGLTKVNDDHFLTFLLTFCTLIGSFSNLLWGYLVDKYQFARVLRGLILFFLIFGILFPILNFSKLGFFLTFQVMGISHKGMMTVIAPGLVQLFGIKLGAEILPIKGTSVFLALATLPLIQVLLLRYLNFDQTIHMILIGTGIAFILSFKLKDSYPFTPQLDKQISEQSRLLFD